MEGIELVAVTEFESSEARAVAELVDRVSADRGFDALSEHKRAALGQAVDGGATAHDRIPFIGVVARRSGQPRPCGFAPVVHDAGGYAIELAVDPEVDDPGGVADALLDAAAAAIAGRGGDATRLWVAQATLDDDVRAASRGFVPERSLLQMRCPLPLTPTARPVAWPPTVRLRHFRPGVDEEAWLRVNNRAFASHPEQGGWTVDMLLEHERAPWFDPDGFLMLEEEGRLMGSCWTKVHPSARPPLGEIYVIGVDPEFHGHGWGRELTRAGLDWLAGRGLTVGMLYVDAANDAAVALYHSLGFVETRRDRAYFRGPDTP